MTSRESAREPGAKPDSPPIRVLVVGDEPLALGILSGLVEADADCRIIGSSTSTADAIAAIRQTRPELVLLDIRLTDRSGFDVIRAIGPAAMPPVVFITAHPSHTPDALDEAAIDYLPAPFSDDRFAEALERGKRRAIERRRAAEHVRRDSAALGRFLVRESRRVVPVRTQDVLWIEADSYYARLHTKTGAHLIRESLTALEGMLDESQFVRVHRSAIVNLDRVKELRPQSKGNWTLLLEDGTALAVSRGRKPNLQARLRRRR